MQNANCPLFYQHFTAKLMEHTIKQQITRLSAPETGAKCSDSEVCGRVHNKECETASQSSQDGELLLALKDLCI